MIGFIKRLWPLFLAGCGTESPPADIVIVTIDTVRADRLGLYGGNARTPHIDALAVDGVRFDNCFSVVPTTLASHSAMFTGHYPRTLAVPRNGFALGHEFPTVAEALRDDGWQTAAFVSSFALDERFGLARGFDTYDSGRTRAEAMDQDWRSGAETVDRVIAWLDGADDDPVFLWIHLFDPHFPYAPEPGFEPEPVPGSDIDGSMETITGIWSGRVIPTEADVAQLVSLYEAEIHYADHQFGRLRKEFFERRQAPAWWIVTSDHGESLGEHDYFFDHGRHLYDGDLKVPLVVEPPPEYRPSEGTATVAATVRTLDLYASILDMAHLPAARGVPSASWLGHWEREAKDRAIYAEATKPHRVEGRRNWPNTRKARAVRLGDHKFIDTPYLGRQSLFSLRTDPGEETPADDEERLEQLRSKLRDWESDTDPSGLRWSPPQEEATRRLEALGYID